MGFTYYDQQLKILQHKDTKCMER